MLLWKYRGGLIKVSIFRKHDPQQIGAKTVERDLIYPLWPTEEIEYCLMWFVFVSSHKISYWLSETGRKYDIFHILFEKWVCEYAPPWNFGWKFNVNWSIMTSSLDFQVTMTSVFTDGFSWLICHFITNFPKITMNMNWAQKKRKNDPLWSHSTVSYFFRGSEF